MKHETKKISFKNSIFRCIALPFLAQTRELHEHERAPLFCLSVGLALPHLLLVQLSPLFYTTTLYYAPHCCEQNILKQFLIHFGTKDA